MGIHRILPLLFVAALVATAQQEAPAPPAAPAAPPIRFNKNFEGASLGKIVQTGPGAYRLHVQGQYDERGHNRQTTWFYFRLDGAKGRPVTLVLTDWIGEYNDRPGANPMGPDLRPVFSADGEAWTFFDDESVKWDKEKDELTLTFTPESDALYVAHVPPYTPRHLAKLLAEVDRSPHARVEVIGKTALGREMVMVTVTDLGVPDEGKKSLWLQARQHAWEAGTSWVMEGALRFITSDDPAAVELRKKNVFRFTPMVDVDGCAAGNVRFNANGYDVNRHWDKVDLRDKRWLRLMPEIWYTKKAVLSAGRIDLMVNMHNTETNEYVQTMCDDEAVLKRMRRFEDLLVEKTSYDPHRRLTVGKLPSNTTNALWQEGRVPVMLMEQRISTSKKAGRRLGVEDRVRFGAELVRVMAEAVGN